MTLRTLAFGTLLIIAIRAGAVEKESEPEAYWDYGFGIGAVRLEHYPASNEFWTLALPAPTFQYRGKILRADDRDGAHLYLYKGDIVTVELAGEGTPGLSSSDSAVRKGMADLPWVAALGAQLVYRPISDFEFASGLYQALATDFKTGKPAGNILEAHVTYNWIFPIRKTWPFTEDGYSTGKFNFSLKSATADNLAFYFDVPSASATSDRPAYDARAGLLSRSFSYYQTFKSGRASYYMGAALKSYDISANRQSPLHKSDNNVLAFFGFNYTLGESSKPAVPREQTGGVLDGLRNRQLRDNF